NFYHELCAHSHRGQHRSPGPSRRGIKTRWGRMLPRKGQCRKSKRTSVGRHKGRLRSYRSSRVTVLACAKITVCDEGLSWWMRGTKCSCGHSQFRGSLAQEATLGQIGERFSAILAGMRCCRGNRCCRPARSSRFAQFLGVYPYNVTLVCRPNSHT